MSGDGGAILVGSRQVQVRVVRHPRARGYRLRLDRDGVARLTMPARGSERRAIEWAGRQAEWIEGELARQRTAGCVLADAAMVPVEGRPVCIAWDAMAGRAVRLDGDRLVLGGPADRVGARVLRWLKARALVTLSADTMTLAGRHGLVPGRIGVGDPRGRWGSCTAGGDIRYSWRLIMAPPDVRIATVAHELAHLRHMDHSPAFHAFHRAICPTDTVAAREWLRRNGAALHGVSAG